MSMNLCLEGFNLYQTRTHISYLCCTQPDGSIRNTLTGNKAVHALQLYKQCIKFPIYEDSWDKEDLMHFEQEIKIHIQQLDNFIRNNKEKLKLTIV